MVLAKTKRKVDPPFPNQNLSKHWSIEDIISPIEVKFEPLSI